MANSQDIQSYKIGSLFKLKEEYKIPIYQRNYAWGKGQIEQLIQDVLDFSEEHGDKTYYIGTLVVFERQEKSKVVYETIDGQQRLTTLSILLSVLRNEFSKNDFDFTPLLSYESRVSANKTFDSIYNQKKFTNDCNTTMKDAYEIVKSYLENNVIKQDKLDIFATYLLSNVEILRVKVPQDTDLNHYFEIINNRGEQLEKHEVLKSYMLAEFEDDEIKKRKTFSTIWDACSDMTRYIQYGFSNEKNTKYRKKLFGKKWDEFNHNSFEELVAILEFEDSNDDKFTLEEIVDPANKLITDINQIVNKNKSERFTSPVNFQNFLLHVLRIQIISNPKNDKVDIPLDDKRLIDSFSFYLNKEFVETFCFNLLKAKYLLDNYVLKRDYKNDSEDGEWSLKKLFDGTSSAQYNNSFGEYNANNEKIIKLLSMFHVSNPSQIYKHWLTGVLNFLINQNVNDISDSKYIKFLENQAQLFLRNRYLANEETDYLEVIFKSPKLNTDINVKELDDGTNVENFIFNYLDYLLWRDDEINRFDKFHFTFRSSVEHFYPQNPLDGQKRLQDTDKNNDYLNSFGNLCLISASKNSKFSNLQPGGKESHYKGFDGISPKQYLMMQKAQSWWKDEIVEHQNEMTKILGLNNESQ